MSLTYTRELELLILDILLPAYEKQQKDKGIIEPFLNLPEKLFNQIKHRRQLPMLLLPKQKLI